MPPDECCTVRHDLLLLGLVQEDQFLLVGFHPLHIALLLCRRKRALASLFELVFPPPELKAPLGHKFVQGVWKKSGPGRVAFPDFPDMMHHVLYDSSALKTAK